MKKILVVFTGGTIGSTEKNGLIDIDERNNFQLISLYRQYKNDLQAEFDTIKIMETLSENITAKHWEVLCNYLLSVDFSNYSGIIITHGSDTLAFTSALVGMLFSHTEIPIILIASNLTLGTPGSNGLKNFAMAVEHISSGKSKGIFTIFDKTYLSTRIMPADSCLDKFSSYGDYDTKKLYNKISQRKATNQLIKHIEFKNEIMMIYGYPNINFSVFNLSDKVSAVLYVPYHSGTACTDSDNADYTLTAFIQRCKANKIPVYICGIKKRDGIYVTLEKLLNSGAIPMWHISEVAAYAKLMIAYNQDIMGIEEFLNQDLFYETF